MRFRHMPGRQLEDPRPLLLHVGDHPSATSGFVQATHEATDGASSLGERTGVRPLQWSVDVVARMSGLPVERVHGLHLGLMSSAWLRQHEMESEKQRAEH